MEREIIEKLWIAAQLQSAYISGQYIDPEWDSPDIPPCPDDSADAIRQVTEYLGHTSL